MTRSRRMIFVLALIALVLGLDRITKVLAIDSLAGIPPRDFLGGTVRLVYQENHGAMLSLGANLPESIRFLFFGALVALLLMVLLLIVLVKRELSTVHAASASLVIGGGLGNVVDRFLFDGAVIDFLNVGIGQLRTGVFNLADVMILAGILLFAMSRKGGPDAQDGRPRPPNERQTIESKGEPGAESQG
jgi:signal peptidase II